MERFVMTGGNILPDAEPNTNPKTGDQIYPRRCHGWGRVVWKRHPAACSTVVTGVLAPEALNGRVNPARGKAPGRQKIVITPQRIPPAFPGANLCIP
jgi:hypothetical protein